MTLVVALLVGAAIGAAGGVTQEELDTQSARAERAEKRSAAAERERDRLRSELDESEERVEELRADVKKLSQKGEVPSFVGDDVEDAESDEAIEAYDWKIRTRQRISDEPPGTVIAQNPREGTTLKAGRSITLTVAKKAPPKPKQWVTIKTLSGASATKTPEFKVPEGVTARLVYNMPGDGNNAITLYKAPKEYVDLVLNEIGPQSGTTRLYEPGTFYLDVSGSYTIQVQVFKRPA